jgi:superfamily II DNA or RNA helicase
VPRELRDYQAQAVQAVYDGWAEHDGAPQGIVLPTGCGKTDIIAAHAVDEARAGGRTLVLADRAELLDQVTERVGMHDPSILVGRAEAGVVGQFRPVIVGMVQTVRSVRRQSQLPRPTKIIVDECDLATAASYQAVFDWAPDARRMGVTATMSRPRPKRGEAGLGDIWPHVAFARDIQWAVDEGWLVPPRGRVVVADHLDLSKVKTVGGDYRDGELGELVAQDTPHIVEAWLEHGEDRITGAYWPTVAAANAALEAFAAAGVKSEIVTGATPADERRAIYARVQEGTTRVLHSVGVLTRGWDCPPLSCILMARPTKMPHLYQQIIGRGLRPSPATGKVDCLVLDVVGSTRVNTLATLIDLYRAARVEDDRPVELVYCEECGYPRPAPGLEVAPLCRCVREKVERDPDGGRERIENARYEDLDLFARSRLHWQVTRRLGRRFLAVGDRLACVWPELDGSFCAIHLAAKGVRSGVTVAERFDIRELVAGVSMEAATACAELWAERFDAADLQRRARAVASRAKPNYGQLSAAAKFRVFVRTGMTAGQIQAEIDVTVASARLDYL